MTITVLAIYFIFLFDGEIKCSTSKFALKLHYTGLLWVGLDYWSIWTYGSNDQPKKWLDSEWKVI